MPLLDSKRTNALTTAHHIALRGVYDSRESSDTVIRADVRLAVDALAQLFANLEVRKALGLNGHRTSRARVTACVGAVVPCREASESSNLDALIAQDRVRNAVENLTHDGICGAARKIMCFGERFDEIGTVHEGHRRRHMRQLRCWGAKAVPGRI